MAGGRRRSQAATRTRIEADLTIMWEVSWQTTCARLKLCVKLKQTIITNEWGVFAESARCFFRWEPHWRPATHVSRLRLIVIDSRVSLGAT